MMTACMKFICAFVMSIACTAPLQPLEVYEYENTRGGDRYPSVIRIAPEGKGYTVNVELDSQIIEATLDGNHANRTLRYINNKDKIDLLVVRDGNKARISGRFRGTDIGKDLDLDDAPWCQFIECNFAGFIVSKDDKFRYWVFAGPQNDMFKMEMHKDGIETIVINGVREEVWHVVAAPVGFYSLFWHADFWFRKRDGMYLQYSAVEGFGAPPTVTRFKSRTATDDPIDASRD
jgi:hypothetical protein